jgi:hypothetical protein
MKPLRPHRFFASLQADLGARAFDGTPTGRGRALDSAAGGSGLAFLQSQLEYVDTDIVEPLQAVTHPRDIWVDNSGSGFPQWISAFAINYATTGTQNTGLQGTQNTEIALAQADLQKGFWPTNIWASGFFIGWLDLQRLQTAKKSGLPPPISLQDMYEQSVETKWVKDLDRVTYLGWNGYPGLVNNSNAFETVAPAGAGGSTLWTKKSPQEILNDINNMQNSIVEQSGYDIAEAMPDSLLIPYTQFAALSQPMAIGGSPVAVSIISYVEKECVAAKNGVNFKINSLPNPWISGQGSGGLDRAVFYKNSKKSLYLDIPQQKVLALTVPTNLGTLGPGYSSSFFGCISNVIFKRTLTMGYLDGI